MKQELPVGTFGSILGESVKSEASFVKVEEESVKPEVEGDPGMERKPKAEPDSQFGIKSERWMKTEKEMKMEWMLPTDSKSIGKGMKTGLIEKVEDLWDSVARLEAIDPGLYKVVLANMLRLHAKEAQIDKLEDKLACKEKELAQKDDLISTKDKKIDELQQQIHALQPENEAPKEQVKGNNEEELELGIPTTMSAANGSICSDSEEQKRELLGQFMEGLQCTLIMP